MDSVGREIFICDFDDSGDKAIVVHTSIVTNINNEKNDKINHNIDLTSSNHNNNNNDNNNNNNNNSIATNINTFDEIYKRMNDACNIYIPGRSNSNMILKLHKTFDNVLKIMIDDYLQNGMEQVLMLCHDSNNPTNSNSSNDIFAKPLVTLVKSFILSSISWSCISSRKDKSLTNGDSDHVLTKRKRVIAVDGDNNNNNNNNNSKMIIDNDAESIMKTTNNRTSQLNSMAEALVSRLSNAENVYNMHISTMHMKEDSIQMLKNEIYNCHMTKNDTFIKNNTEPNQIVANNEEIKDYNILQLIKVSHDKYDSSNGKLSIHVTLKNRSDRDVYSTSLRIIFNDNKNGNFNNNNNIQSKSNDYVYNESQICLSSKSSYIKLMKPNEEVEIVLNAEIFNVCVDLSMNDAYEHVVKNCFHRELSIIASLEVHENGNNNNSMYRGTGIRRDDGQMILPLYSFSLSSIMIGSISANENTMFSIIPIKNSPQETSSSARHDGCNESALILRLMLMPKCSYLKSFNMNDAIAGLEGAFYHLGWNSVGNPSRDNNNIKFQLKNLWKFAMLDIYSGDSIWSHSHGLNMNCFIGTIKNVIPSTLYIVPTIFTKLSLNLVSGVLNAVLNENQKLSQLQLSGKNDHDHDSSALIYLMKAQSQTDLLVGQLLNSLSI